MHKKENNEYTYEPLIPGQHFQYAGKNGVPYFTLDVVEQKDGSVFPMTKTAPACNALPLECDEKGHVVAVYLLKQTGRPEGGVSDIALKATGSFCKVGETTRACALRSLTEKLAIAAHDEDLIFTGTSYGFGPQFQFPIDLYVLTNFTLTDVPLIEGCERVRMSIADIAKAQAERRFFNSETIDLVATVLLRNAERNTFQW